MQINITGRGIELTPAIESYVHKKIEALDKFYNQIIRAQVIVGIESHHHTKGSIFFAECRLEVPGRDIFVSETKEDLYQAIDKVRDHAEAELKKHKTKEREKTKQDKMSARHAKEYTLAS